MLAFLINLLQLLVSPGRAWEDISYEDTSPEELCRRGFYPLLALTALSCLALMMHQDVSYSLATVLQQATITVTALFATLFIGRSVIIAAWPRFSSREVSERRASTMVTYSLSMMACFIIITNLVPLELAILKFLPLYVAVLIWKARNYIGVDNDHAVAYMVIASLVIIVPVYVLDAIFKSIVPGA